MEAFACGVVGIPYSELLKMPANLVIESINKYSQFLTEQSKQGFEQARLTGFLSFRGFNKEPDSPEKLFEFEWDRKVSKKIAKVTNFKRAK